MSAPAREASPPANHDAPQPEGARAELPAGATEGAPVQRLAGGEPDAEREEGGTAAELAATLAPTIEAILLTLERPAPARRLAEALGLVSPEAEEPEARVKGDEGGPASSQPTGDQPAGQSAGDQHAEGQPGGAQHVGEPAGAESSAGTPASEAAPSKPKRRRSAKLEDARQRAAQEALERVANAVTLLNTEYERTGRSFRIESVAGGYRMMTLAEYADAIGAFNASRSPGKLTRAAIETLAIVAYKQPITKAYLETIRGVSCGEVIKTLMERRLITIKGRAEELGRPILYGTTKHFLDVFGLASLKDLPTIQELQLPQ
ncbi:MAG: SMC-Scp complex subunit ScpB [Planctomycetota bacterium]|nr:SMC-Scp complex subunit ScpB [Planctomycetota bacterium]